MTILASTTLYDTIEIGDRVKIRTSHGAERWGRAAIINYRHDVIVLNGGGSYGVPLVATRENVVAVRKGAP